LHWHESGISPGVLPVGGSQLAVPLFNRRLKWLYAACPLIRLEMREKPRKCSGLGVFSKEGTHDPFFGPEISGDYLWRDSLDSRIHFSQIFYEPFPSSMRKGE
jgi:hypothetical protein